MIKELPSCFCF